MFRLGCKMYYSFRRKSYFNFNNDWFNISGADNSNSSSNQDTSMKFGKKHPYVILFQNQS